MRALERMAVTMVFSAVLAAAGAGCVFGVDLAVVPEQPTGKKRSGPDHREFTSQFRVIEFRNPANGNEGTISYWPDGMLVMAVKRPDGTLFGNLGRWRVVGDTFCTDTRLPPGSKESCVYVYDVEDGKTHANWGVGGKFGVYWWYRERK